MVFGKGTHMGLDFGGRKIGGGRGRIWFIRERWNFESGDLV